MKYFICDVLAFLSPRGKIGRLGFLWIFLVALLSVRLLRMFTFYLWYMYEPMAYFKVNFAINVSSDLGLIGLLTGFLPLTLLVLWDGIHVTYLWADEIGYRFLVEAVVVNILYVLFLFQCIKRCHDMGRSWWWCLIPLYNPFMLLLKKSKVSP